MIGFEPASFKDPAGRVFYHGDVVCRTLSESAHHTFEAADRGGLIKALVADDLLVPSELVTAADLGIRDADASQFLLRQPRLPLVTYSYEWSFEMLRDAALVTLRVLDRALAAGFILKDANAFNMLFDGTIPKLVDAPSIERYREGDVWAGYAQFCRSFLFPLLLASYRDLDIQPLLRGTLGELPIQLARRLITLRDYAKAGVFKDIVLQARLDHSFAGAEPLVSTAATSAYPKALLVGNVRRLLGIIERLKGPSSPTEWTAYDTFHSYSDEDRRIKATFVTQVFTPGRFGRVVDLGCNTGEYADVARSSVPHVIAIDLDSRAIDRLYRRTPKSPALSPVVANLLNPTPAMGWALRERRSLLDRIKSDGFLALALIHHLRITGGVPLEQIVGQLFTIAPEGVVEWVDKEDAMVRSMLSLRPDVYDDYNWPQFQALVSQHADIVFVQPTHGGRRRLCHVRVRAASAAAAPFA
jgi:hypothetical protein